MPDSVGGHNLDRLAWSPVEMTEALNLLPPTLRDRIVRHSATAAARDPYIEDVNGLLAALLARTRHADKLQRERDEFGPLFVRDFARVCGLPDDASLDEIMKRYEQVAEKARHAEQLESCDCVPCIVSSKSCPKCGRIAVVPQEQMVRGVNELQARVKELEEALAAAGGSKDTPA